MTKAWQVVDVNQPHAAPLALRGIIRPGETRAIQSDCVIPACGYAVDKGGNLANSIILE